MPASDKCFIPSLDTHLIFQNLWILDHLNIDKPSTIKTSYSVKKNDRSIAEEYWHSVKKLDRRIVIALHPCTQAPRKNWAIGNFHKLLKLIQERYDPAFVFFGSQIDSISFNSLLEQYRAVSILQAGETNIGTAAALLNKCDLLISIDSGIMHLAKAVGTPVYGIFISTEPGLYGYDDGNSKNTLVDIRSTADEQVHKIFTGIQLMIKENTQCVELSE